MKHELQDEIKSLKSLKCVSGKGKHWDSSSNNRKWGIHCDCLGGRSAAREESLVTHWLLAGNQMTMWETLSHHTHFLSAHSLQDYHLPSIIQSQSRYGVIHPLIKSSMPLNMNRGGSRIFKWGGGGGTKNCACIPHNTRKVPCGRSPDSGSSTILDTVLSCYIMTIWSH